MQFYIHDANMMNVRMRIHHRFGNAFDHADKICASHQRGKQIIEDMLVYNNNNTNNKNTVVGDNGLTTV